MTFMKDFDYIGAGGFFIVCGGTTDGPTDAIIGREGAVDSRVCGYTTDCDGTEALGITKEQADIILKSCPFFQKCLNQPGEDSGKGDRGDDDVSSNTLMMKEAQDRIVYKPDWSLAIARHFVEVLTKGKTTLNSLDLYEQLMAAGDQALVDLRLSSMVNYMDPCSRDNDFLRLVDPGMYCFQFHAHVSSAQWLSLLDRGILLYRRETNYVVQFYKEQAVNPEQMVSRRKLDNRSSEFLVHADRPIEAIFEIQKCLACKNSDDGATSRRATTIRGPLTESFSVYFETKEPIPKDQHELIDRLAGGEAYIRTCADAAEYQTEGYTIKSSLDVLARAIHKVDESSVIHCSFRVDNPTPDTLGRLINACQKAEIHSSTLGVDVDINRYFCRKSMEDMKIVLEYMADYSTTAKVIGDFQLFELSSVDHCF